MCTLPIVWVAFSGVGKSLSPQGTGQVEVKENPPSPRLRRWQPKKLGDRFFVGKFWIYPPHPGLPATNWNFLTFCLQGLPKKHTFISPLLFGCVGGGVDPMFGQVPLHQWLMWCWENPIFCWRPDIHHFHFFSVAAELDQWHWQLNPRVCLSGIRDQKCRSLRHLRLAQASRIWIDMDRHTSTYTPEN